LLVGRNSLRSARQRRPQMPAIFPMSGSAS
jgi:hypothetical protein